MNWKSMMKIGTMTMGIGLLAACGKVGNTTTVKESSTQTQSQTQENKTTTTAKLATDQLVTEEYLVKTGNKTLYGQLTAPSNYKEHSLPIVILAHGFNSTLERYNEYVKPLVEQGYLVYRFDFYGGSRQSKSGGTDMLEISVKTEEEELAAVVEQLAKESFVDQTKISVVGASQGGAVATMFAADYPDQISKLILFYPAYVLFDEVVDTYNRLGVSSIDAIPDVLTHHNAQLGSIYLKDALDVDINEKIQSVKAPTLIVHGTNDNVVPYSYAQNANQLFKESKLVTVEGGGHRLDDRFNQIAIPELLEFLKK